MNSGTCGLSWTGFSAGDMIALNALWPLRYLVSFSGGSLPETFVVPGSLLNRSIMPTSQFSGGGSSIIFSGWYKDAALTKPWVYGLDKINSDITLYPKWRGKSYGSTSKIETSSYTSGSIPFTINETTGVSLTAQVNRGLWEWYEIGAVCSGGNVLAIVGRDGSIRKQIYMDDYIKAYMWTAASDTRFEQTGYVVLDSGSHWFAASFPGALGPQNGASTKHGVTYAIIKY
jgi:hypothetical protein